MTRNKDKAADQSQHRTPCVTLSVGHGYIFCTMKFSTFLGLTGLVAFLPTLLWGANPLQTTSQPTTSVSHAYGSRSVFTNPAALGYETALNGAGWFTAYTTGIGAQGDHSLSLSYGLLGVAAEWINDGPTKFNRYSLGFGAPMGPYVFWGARYQFTRAQAIPLRNFNSFDLGLQIRASRYVSFGLLGQTLNQPTVSGTKIPFNLVAGIVVRPVDPVELTLDIDTTGTPLGKTFGYDANVRVEVLRGLKLAAGYHHTQKWQLGIQFNLSLGSFFSVVQPDPSGENFIFGGQTSFRPYPTSLSGTDTLEVALESGLREEPVEGNWFSRSRPSLYEILKKLKTAQKSPDFSRIIVRIEEFPLGLAAAEEVFGALRELREHGKTVEVYLGNASLKEYYIASAANRVVMEPSSELRLLGFKYSRYYLKGTLDKVGIEGELFAKGKYKSMPEMFTRKDASPLMREESLRQLKKLEEIFLASVKNTRLTPEKWKQALAQGVYGADEAKAAGLIDEVSSFDVDKDAKTFATSKRVDRYRDNLQLPSRIAIIPASGDIISQKSPLLAISGQYQIFPEKLEAYLEEATSDPLTKAIVLRVSSGGGEILASQQIATLVEKAKKKKPLVVSMGDAAASGGYMISAPADAIFANSTTLTGSIGVFLGKASLSGLYKKIDLHKEILSHAPYAGLYSEHKSLSDAEKRIFVRRLDDYYDHFVRYVANKRGLDMPKAESAAQGRVWLGEEAEAQKLIDYKGGYLQAVEHAAKLAGLAPDQFDTYILGTKLPLFSVFGEDGWIQSEPGFLSSPAVSELARQVYWAASFEKQPFLYLSPIEQLE